MTPDELRQRVTEALGDKFLTCYCEVSARRMADALLPVVEEYGRDCAAAAQVETFRRIARLLELCGVGDRVKRKLLAAYDSLGIEVPSAQEPLPPEPFEPDTP